MLSVVKSHGLQKGYTKAATEADRIKAVDSWWQALKEKCSFEHLQDVDHAEWKKTSPFEQTGRNISIASGIKVCNCVRQPATVTSTLSCS